MTSILQDGHVSLITGAASGIGEACARSFAAEGARLCLADRSIEAARHLAEQICEEGGDAFAVAVDVAERGQVEAMVQSVIGRFGRLDSAVNSAGIISAYAVAGEITDAIWDQQLAINLTGTFYAVRAQIEVMRRQGSGSIINISSGAGLKGTPGAAAYSAAKHAIVGLTRTAALDHGRDGVRVNAICPGYIETPIHQLRVAEGRQRDIGALCPIGRPGLASEIADAAAWLASPRSSYVTGVALPVDGGFCAM